MTGYAARSRSQPKECATELNLIGLASFDFIVSAGVPYLLEVNPRPGASLDVLDDGGELFAAHIAVWTGANNFPGQEIARAAKAIAILHADRGPITLGKTPWPGLERRPGRSRHFRPPQAPLSQLRSQKLRPPMRQKPSPGHAWRNSKT